MGTALGRRLLTGGHQLTAWNRSPDRAGELESAGARLASSPTAAVEGVELAITTLANDEAVRSVALGGEGLIAALAPDAGYVDCSTVSPALGEELARAAGSDRFVAMPIAGAPQAVLGGSAVYLPGGSDAAFSRLEPIMAGLGGRYRRYPTPGQAGTAKLANNLMLLAAVMALSEAFAVGRAGGLDDAQLRELLGENPVVPAALRNRFDGVLTGRQDAWWTTVLGAKDAGLAVDVARAAERDLPLSEVVRDAYRRAAQSGYADDDIVAVRWLYQ